MNIPSELLDLLRKPSKVVIVTHFKPDADALGSSLGLSGYLKKKNHEVRVIAPSDYPDFLNWMPGSKEVTIVRKGQPATQQEAETFIRNAELIFCLDFSGLSRIETLEDPVRHAPAYKVMIDHHLEPENFSHFSLWDLRSASTAGLVLRFMDMMGDADLVDESIATCLYAGLMTDTGGFRHNNTTADEFETAARLTRKGAVPNEIAARIYDSSSIDRLKLTGHVLCNKLTVLSELRTAYMTLSKNELENFSFQTGDTEGLVNYGLSIKGIQLSVFFIERDDQIKISFRSVGTFSVNELARKHFNGGGHRNAAGGSSTESLQDTVNRFLNILNEYRDKLLSN